jgi:hypothetical protein
MSVIDCPVCGRPVNAEAIRCPECGGNPRLPAARARAEVAARYGVGQVAPKPPLPGWSRRRRILAAIPGLIIPLSFAGVGVAAFVSGWHFYFSLPAAQRADGDPFPADAGMWLGVALVVVALLLAALAVGAALARRLNVGWGVTLLIASLGIMGLAIWTAVSVPLGWWSMCAVPFAYVPALIVVRLLWQSSGRHGGPERRLPNKHFELTRSRLGQS